MSVPLESSLVRIYNRSDKVIGAGFLVSQNKILTCAHVVAYALGIKADAATPQAEISLDFPRLAPGKMLKAKIVFWRPVNPNEKYEDIAGLELIELPPNTAKPVYLVTADNLWGHYFRVFGFPGGQSNGVWASGELRGFTGNGWVQVEDIKSTGYRLEEGFSGAPVWDEKLNGVAGMAVAADKHRPDAKAAFIIPTNLLVEAWDVLKERAIAACPYKGLLTFQEEDAKFFFGREDLTQDLVNAVENQKLVPVIGPSGSGKSSVVFAGLIPELRKKPDWLIEDFRPKNYPFNELARALVRLENSATGKEDLSKAIELAKQLKEEPSALETYLSAILETTPNAHLLLVADQFEEIFKTGDRQIFLQRLFEVVKKMPRLRLIFTMRADFMEKALSDPILAEALDNDVKVKPMSSQQLQDAIAKPASGLVQIESGLTTRILEDALTENISDDATGKSSQETSIEKAGYLPLVEFALEKLWQKQENGWLTHQAYEDIGGVKGAIAQHANQVFQQLSQNLSDREAQEKAQQIFIQLVHPGQNNLHTRQIATRSQLGEEKWNLVAYLAGEDCRLVVTNRNQVTKEETVELIHEALIREWQLFGDWIKENRDFRIWQDRLRVEIKSGDLLADNRLTRAEYWLQERGDELSDGEKEFIQESVRKREGDRRRILIIAIAIGSLMTVLAGAAGVFGLQTQRQKIEAEIRADALLAKSLLDVEPVEALTRAIEVTGRSQEKLGKVLPLAQSSLSEAIQVARERNLLKDYERHLANLLENHQFFRSSVVMNKEGSKIISSSDDSTIRVWDLKSGEQLKVLEGHKLIVNSIAITPDGSKIVSGSRDKTIRVWNLNTGEQLFLLKGHESYVNSVAITSDGSKIVSGSDDRTIRVWDLNTGEQLAVLKGHEFPVYSVAIAPDSSKIISGSDDSTIRVWDLNTGKQLAVLKGHEFTVNSVAITLDSSKIISGSSDRKIRVWDFNTGEQLAVLKGHQSDVNSVAITSDNSKIVSGSSDNTIRVWDLNSGEQLDVFKGHKSDVNSVAITPNGSTIISGSSGSTDRTIRVWNLNTGEQLSLLKGHESDVNSVAITSDGSKIVSGSSDNTIRVWDFNTGEQLAVFKGHENSVSSVAITPDGSKIIFGSWETLRVWDFNTGEQLAVFKGHESTVNSVAITPDGSKIVSGSRDTTIRVWDLNSGEQLAVFKGHENSVSSVAITLTLENSKIISGAGRIIPVSGRDDKTIRVWDLNSGEQLAVFKGHESIVNSVAITPDGSKIVFGSSDNMIRVWDLNSGEQLAIFKGHESIVNSVAITPDGSKIVSGSEDNTIRVWDLNSGDQLALFKGHKNGVTSVAISPDGSKIVSGSEDNTIRLWRGTWQGWLDAGCEQLRLHPVFVEAFIKDREDGEDGEDRQIAREAVKTCEKGVKENGSPIWNHQEKAEFRVREGLAVARLTGDFEQAKDKFKEAQNLDPEFYDSLDYDPEEKARQLINENN